MTRRERGPRVRECKVKAHGTIRHGDRLKYWTLRGAAMAPDTIERISTLNDPALLRQQCYVDGRWIDADSGATHPVVNPATGRSIGTVPILLGAETRKAIEAAERALPAWRTKTAKERSA